MNELNRTMMTLARESRGLSQAELAERTGTTQSHVGKMEANKYGVSEEWLDAIAGATNYPVSFFYQPGEILPENLNYRRREKVAQSVIAPLNARINIQRLQIEMVTNELNLPAPKVPSFEVDEKNTPAVIAQRLRKLWKLENGPIGNLTNLLEQNGIIVRSFDFETDRVDSRTLVTENGFPVLFLNGRLLGDRQRFSLAYQLGHLVMHTYSKVDWQRDTGHEANLFAAEFLMPEKGIRKDFSQDIAIGLLANLKSKWKVSMISLLYRADDLGFLTEHQKRQLVQQFNELQIRRREPADLDVPAETPRLMKQWLAQLKAKQKLSTAALAEKLHLNTNEFIELYS